MGTTQTLAPMYERPSGRTYSGSLAEFRGQRAVAVGDCYCGPCTELDLWDMARGAVVLLESGARLEHVRWSSLT